MAVHERDKNRFGIWKTNKQLTRDSEVYHAARQIERHC